MSITELTTYELPKYRKQLQRRLQHPVRYLRRALRTYVARQYFVSTAFADVRTAARANEDIVIATLLVAFLIFVGFSALAAQFLYFVASSSLAVSDNTHAPFLILFFATIGFVGVMGTWLAAFLSNSLSIALMQGSTGKRIRSIRATLRSGLSKASLVSQAWLLLAALIAVPLMGMAILSAIILTLLGNPDISLPTILIYAAIASAVWAMYVLATYSLAAHVALFEDLPSVFDSLKRSRQLVARRGRMFLLVIHLMTAVLIAGAWFLNSLANKAGVSDAGIFYCGSFATLLLGSSLKTALYRKRKLARSR